MAGELAIRAAREEDAAALLSIYAPYVREAVITFEVDVPTLTEFAGRIRGILSKYPYLVAERDGEIVGYAYASSFRTRAAYDWSAETSVYVRMDEKRGGIGSALYGALERALRGMNIQTLIACITYPNHESVGFHKRFGYRYVGVMEKVGYKFNRWMDVLWMEKSLGDHALPANPIIPYPETK